MKDLGNGPKGRPRWVHVSPAFAPSVAENHWTRPELLYSRHCGEVVTDHRSSWVRRIQGGSDYYYVKTYDYPHRRDRLRGALRTTFLSASRVVREWRALTWLRDHGFAAPAPCGALEVRHHGWLQRAVLVTAEYPGEALDRLLPRLPDNDRDQLLTDLEGFIVRLHTAGFRDKNLDLRNLLARRSEDGWEIAVIDSPRHALVRPGCANDHAARRDWQRLCASLEEVGLLPFRPPGRPPAIRASDAD